MTLKTLVFAVALLAAACLSIPVIIGGNSTPESAPCADIAPILDTIRSVESGGNYSTAKNRGGASGAYQYIDSTWNHYDGYQSALLAPPAVQDARAASDVHAILTRYGDVAFVPVIWYWPRAATDPTQLDIIPYPTAGNRLTVREYQQHWLTVYQTKTVAAGTDTTCAAATAGEGDYALPLDRLLLAARPQMLDEPHHDYPAIDLLVPVGYAVYAVRAGTVARVVDWTHNCYEVAQCTHTCGVGISIDGDDGARYIYCHGNQLDDIAVGDVVVAGQRLMWSGNTGRSGAPHLHLEIRVKALQRCPQALLHALFHTGRAPSPDSLAIGGCTF